MEDKGDLMVAEEGLGLKKVHESMVLIRQSRRGSLQNNPGKNKYVFLVINAVKFVPRTLYKE